MSLFFPILSSITKSSSLHLALGGTMPDPGLPPSAAKHVGGGGGIQESPLKQEQTGKGESQRKSSWRLLRFLEVFFLPPQQLSLGRCMYVWLWLYFHCAVKVLVAQSCPTLCDSMDYVASVHGILQARLLEWIAILFSRESFLSRDQTQSPTSQVGSSLPEPPGWWPLKIKMTLCACLWKSRGWNWGVGFIPRQYS